MCVTRTPSCSMRASSVGEGGAPPVRDAQRRIEAARPAPRARSASMSSTVGAPLKCVTRSWPIEPEHARGIDARSITCVPPAAVTAHGKHQPLQWNSGSVQRKTVSRVEALHDHLAERVQVARRGACTSRPSAARWCPTCS